MNGSQSNWSKQCAEHMADHPHHSVITIKYMSVCAFHVGAVQHSSFLFYKLNQQQAFGLAQEKFPISWVVVQLAACLSNGLSIWINLFWNNIIFDFVKI